MAISEQVTADMVALNGVDQEAFGALVEPHRRALQAHAYRMLGSVQEAEDVVQDALLRAWQRRETYAGRAPLRAWLYRIVTNLCLDRLEQRQLPGRSLPQARQARQAPEGGRTPLPPPVNEPVWLEPFPDELLAPDEASPEARYSQRESVTLAFMTSLQLLPPRQRAVLILRDVLDWPASEAADLLELSVPAVKSALHRARTTLSAHFEAVQLERLSARGLDAARQKQLDRYARAWEMADVDGLAALLKAEASFSMPPTPLWVRGVADIRTLVGERIFGGQPGRWKLAPTRANGEAGFVVYRLNEQSGAYDPYGVQVVRFEGDEIADMTTFRVPALVQYFRPRAALKQK